MGNWLSLKTFEIQHALYGSRLRLWLVPVTNTLLASCWGKTSGVLVLLQRKLVPVSNRRLPSSLLLLHILSHKTHSLGVLEKQRFYGKVMLTPLPTNGHTWKQ